MCTQVLHAALREMGAGRAVQVGRDVRGSNLSFSPGIYRKHFNGGAFPLHIDSLRSHTFARRPSCAAARGGVGERVRLVGRSRSAAAYADLYRFESQFSALLLLQRSERPAPELSSFDVHKDELARDCSLKLRPSTHNVALVTPPTEPWLARKLAARRSCDLDIEEGDLYVFNSNRLHVVHPIGGRTPRVTLGTFVGVSAEELRIWT